MTESTYFIEAPQHKDVGPNSAKIYWKNTEEPETKGQVLYWEEGKGEQQSDESPLKMEHEIVLTGLKPNTLYHYRARSTREAAGFPGGVKVSISPLPPASGSFRTLPAFDWRGFFSPVNNPPSLNEVNPGRTIPVKFRLGGDQGKDIFAAGYPKCGGTATAGSLSYDASEDQYTYLWRTEKAWSGRRTLEVKLKDNSVHTAEFDFK
jgi:hypothetical protein